MAVGVNRTTKVQKILITKAKDGHKNAAPKKAPAVTESVRAGALKPMLKGESIVVGLDFEEGLRMEADGANLGGVFADVDVSAVAAHPDGVAIA